MLPADFIICEESGVGAELIQEKIPVSKDMRDYYLPSGKDVYDMVMNDSDDYELIITCSPENIERIYSGINSLGNTPVTEIGRITKVSEGIRLILTDGTKRNILPTGWDHFS